MVQRFWQRWSAEYLTNLQQRYKWKRREPNHIQIGDLVVLKESGLPPLQWKLGIIVALHPGNVKVLRVFRALNLKIGQASRPTLGIQHPLPKLKQLTDNFKTVNPFRIKTWTDSETKGYLPILVVAQQKTQVTAWSVPLAVETFDKTFFFNNVSKTMCHDSMSDIIDEAFSVLPLEVAQSFIISLSTSSPRNIYVYLELEEEKDFYVQLNNNYSLMVSPSEPRYVFYKFDENTADTLVIEVDSEDEICLVASVQDSRCPVMDMNKDIKYEGSYQTINLKGAITVTRTDYFGGFFLVFVANPDNADCSLQNSYRPSAKFSTVTPTNVTSQIKFIVRNSITEGDYKKAILGTLGVLVAMATFVTAFGIILNRRGTISKSEYTDEAADIPDGFQSLSQQQIRDILGSDRLTVDQCARHPRRLEKRSYNYLYHTLSIAIFYGIPVVQLVVTYQRIVYKTGNEDMCYYNFLCAHPAFGFIDFNHIYSNIGYVLFGIIFIIVVVDRQSVIKLRRDRGIPIHYGIYHAMGLALIIEGILSACYHICPSQSNYQFDTSFMYVMAVLCMIKLYQNRHPDVNATAYTTFTILGGAIFIAMIGILKGDWAIWIIFVISYTSLCIVVSFKIYFLNYVMDALKDLKEIVRVNGFCSDIWRPIRRARFLVLLITNIANLTMLFVGLYLYAVSHTDFGTFLLAILMGNAIIHTIFYTTMKVSECYNVL
ncbi:hypothetical protein JTB14_037848 [Gonioctena quinquepunctata]|nr:hypothetical protein JTB14_037848 [Gonioctena quinquepunctata]